jgi:phosphoribosyl 1,2-cyclic phosphodiesterase
LTERRNPRGRGSDMKLEVLASGSKANCYILTAGEDKLILDCGVPFRELQRALDFDYSHVAACLLTHRHNDHSKAWRDVAKYGIDIVMSWGTMQELNADGHRLIRTDSKHTLNIGFWAIQPFDTQHDTQEPLGFLIRHRGTDEKLIYATDTYYLKYNFTGVDYWLIECNYCTDRLLQQYEAGEIDIGLYRRLLQSHMSLENLKTYLAGQDLRSARKIVLLHLSDARSDERRMAKEILELTGVDTVAAADGLTVELAKYPF